MHEFSFVGNSMSFSVQGNRKKKLIGEKRLYLKYVRYINNIINGERSRGLPDDVDEWGTGWTVSRPHKTETE